MRIKYIYSACIVIETDDCRICCDPWFTQGIYDGAWYQYPCVSDPVSAIGKVDYVYVSHIHPDHYDPPFLRRLLQANPKCEVLVGTENQGFLLSKMHRDGLQPISLSRHFKGKTEIAIFPNFTNGEVSIDSALVVKASGMTVVNMNDCPFDGQQIAEIRDFCGRAPDLACLPYAGAGPYPQMYRFDNETSLAVAVETKKKQFMDLFGHYFEALDPKYAMPFAGLYYLGGVNRSRNAYRGVPDALEVKERFGKRVIVLDEEHGQIDLRIDHITHQRVGFMDSTERDRYLSQFDDVRYPYELMAEVGIEELVLQLENAHLRALSRVNSPPERWICFAVFQGQFLCIRADSPGVVHVRGSVTDLGEREVIEVDARLLHGLLTRKFHWNNAEIGSHFYFSRFPEIYDRRVYDLLNFLHV